MSPLVPATGIILLAALWLMSVFAGWATVAFCSDRGIGQGCRADVAAAIRPSGLLAAAAALLAAAALIAPQATRSAAAARKVRMRLLAASAACWAIALAVLFALGEVVGR